MSDREMRNWIVEISCLVDFEDLDHDDRTADGLACRVDGMWSCSFPLGVDREQVLDRFHAEVPISCLENFDILLRPRALHDQEFDIRGRFGPGSEAEVEARFKDQALGRDKGMEP